MVILKRFTFNCKVAAVPMPLPPNPPPPKLKPDEIFPSMFERKTLVPRELSALQAETQVGHEQPIIYLPLPGWTPQKNTADLLRDRIARREQYSWKVDFDDFQMPFYEKIADRMTAAIKEMEALAEQKRIKDQRKFTIVKPPPKK